LMAHNNLFPSALLCPIPELMEKKYALNIHNINHYSFCQFLIKVTCVNFPCEPAIFNYQPSKAGSWLKQHLKCSMHLTERKNCVFITKISHLMLFMEIMPVDCENYMESTYILCRKAQGFWMCKRHKYRNCHYLFIYF
jgi:hypothetical protein